MGAAAGGIGRGLFALDQAFTPTGRPLRPNTRRSLKNSVWTNPLKPANEMRYVVNGTYDHTLQILPPPVEPDLVAYAIYFDQNATSFVNATEAMRCNISTETTCDLYTGTGQSLFDADEW